MTWLTTWTPEKVQAAQDKPRAFAEYCQQTIGTPWPTLKDMTILRKKIKEFFEHYPRCDYRSLCRVANWCRARKRRPTRAWLVIESFRDAWRTATCPSSTRRSVARRTSRRRSHSLWTRSTDRSGGAV
jgi:hypothetical protein